MKQIRIKETIDRRVLGALCFIDQVTGSRIKRTFRIHSPALGFTINRSFLHVIRSATGLASHLSAFETPPAAPQGPDLFSLNFTVTVRDPLGEYLDRHFSFQLPRDPDPDHDENLFEPIEIPMFAAPAARTRPNWSIIRAAVYDSEKMPARKPLPGVLLRVLDTEGRLLTSGLSDPRGEAIVIVPGILITTFSQGGEEPDDSDDDSDAPDPTDWLAAGSVIETQTPVQVESIVTPATPWPVDPATMETHCGDWRKSFRTAGEDLFRPRLELALKTGQARTMTLYIKLTEEE